MAGFREFQTGEVLTAANVNDYLAKQAVMKFADSAARDTALGTAVGGSNALREGMASYLDDADALQIYDGTSWATVGNAGIGSNVVQAVKTDTFATSSTSFVTPTGLSATITPTSSSSKILVIVQLSVSADNIGARATIHGRISGGNAGNYVGDASGITVRNVFAIRETGDEFFNSNIAQTMVYLDSPNTTSPTTYQAQVRLGSSGSSVSVNRPESSTNSADYGRGASSITAIEVAA